MRSHLTLVLALATVIAGLVPSTAVPAPETVLRIHFAGTEAAIAAPGATQLKEIVQQPQTAAVKEFVMRRLMQSPERLSEGRLDAGQVAAVGPLLRSLIGDVERGESVLTVRPSGSYHDWTLAVNLGTDKRVAAWQSQLESLTGTWELGEIRGSEKSGTKCWSVGGESGGVGLTWATFGTWGLVGVGPQAGLRVAELLEQAAASGRPVRALSENWLTVDADLGWLAGAAGLSTDFPWPRVALSHAGEGENVRTSGRILFPEDVTGELVKWQVPTNFITEPLIGFSAARGLAPLLRHWGLLGRLKIPVPNEVYAWSQGAANQQSFVAFPLPGAKERLPEIAAVLPSVFPEWAREKGLTQFEHVAEENAIYWRDLIPVVVPVMQAVEGAGRDFVRLGLFQSVDRGPVPAALLEQLEEPDLLYYAWEITQPRITQQILMTQFISFASDQPQLAPDRAPLIWLREVAVKLGNSVTQVRRVSDREWSVLRKSHVGLTADELLMAARWIESVGFPRPGLTVLASEGSAPKTSPAPPR